MRKPKVRVYHKAAEVNEKGDVSAVCYAKPRRIDLSRATWTFRWEAVTCQKCLSKMREIAKI